MPTTLDVDLVARLRLAVLRLGRRLRQQAESGVTPSQLSALSSVSRDGPLSLGDLAAIEDIAPSTLTRIVAALEAEGLLQRLTDPTDRRVCLVAITRQGRTRLEQFRSRGASYLSSRLATLTAEERATLAAAVPVLEMLLADEG